MTDQTKKQNKGKPPVYQGVLAYFPRAIKAVAWVSWAGAKIYDKPYTEQGWRDVPEGERKDAAARHILDEVIEGPVNQGDSDRAPGLPLPILHMAQQAWGILAALEVALTNEESPVGYGFTEVDPPKETILERGPIDPNAFDVVHASDCIARNSFMGDMGQCDCQNDKPVCKAKQPDDQYDPDWEVKHPKEWR